MCNSRLIGGGRLIAPHAVIDDGWLDVCLIHAMPTLEFVALLRRVSSGDHVDDDRVAYFRTQALELAFERAIRVNTDGQVLEADRCRYERPARRRAPAGPLIRAASGQPSIRPAPTTVGQAESPRRRAMSDRIPSSEITPRHVYLNRRAFMRAGTLAAAAAGTGALYRTPQPRQPRRRRDAGHRRADHRAARPTASGSTRR